MGLAMIGFTVLIIYNSVLAIAVIPSPKASKITSNLKIDDDVFDYETYKTVNMHVIVDDLSYDVSSYAPYIEIVSKEHPVFKYNFVILFNDTYYPNDERKKIEKEISLNTTWKDSNIKLFLDRGINVQRKSLSRYLNESPLRKYWTHLPQHFLGFLIRCVAIWNKGGISINPQLFTPESPHPHYVEKVHDIFKKFEELKHTKKVPKKNNKCTTKTKRVNNIRDIIDALENDSFEIDERIKDVNIAEENKESIVLDKNSTDWSHNNFSVGKEFSVKKDEKRHIPHKTASRVSDNSMYGTINKDDMKDNVILDESDNDRKLFPMFLKFLFSPKNYNVSHKRDEENNIKGPRGSKEYKVHKNLIKYKKYFDVEKNPAKVLNLPTNMDSNIDYDLNIDLKGNIVATKISCHAFLGTIFNTAIHHVKDETVTDFIISELSAFCKGNWIYCKGVDVILL